MTTTDGPRVLLVTSAGASPAAVTPVLAALEAVGISVRAIDAGRMGGDNDGAVERLFRAFVGEVSERRLAKELEANPPDLAIAFDPHVAMALAEARDTASRPAPVLAIIADLSPVSAWAQADADRYLVTDDDTAVQLADHGVEGDRVIVVGAFGEVAFSEAAEQNVASLRQRFRIGTPRVVLVEVAGLGYELAGQIALQLSLAEDSAKTTYLFDAGGDIEAATALRRQVPTLDLKAKLFGDTEDLPLLWRAADVIVARPRERAVSRAMLLGAKFVALMPDDGRSEELVKAVERRKLGVAAATALLLSSSLDATLAVAARPRTPDGAANAADIAWVMATEKRALIDGRRSAVGAATRERVRNAADAASQVAKMAAAPGDLEDLSGGGAPVADEPVVDSEEISRLRREVAERMAQVAKAVAAARTAADSWDKKASALAKTGQADESVQATRQADAERVRMHTALREMHTLEQDLNRLEQAAKQAAAAPPRRPPPTVEDFGSGASLGDDLPPPRPRSGPSVDDLLSRMKREQGLGGGEVPRSARASAPPRGNSTKTGRSAGSNIEDELEALKRKMAAKKK